ncbi:MAG: glycosyltransferase family A protein, partial [Bacteroidales bacterium]
MKLISFLITVYNLDMWLLERCIDSLLMQDIDETDFEIVMIDDGSDVSVESILQKYPNTAIRFYRQTNQGLGAARNKALSLAYGKYCFFVDGD